MSVGALLYCQNAYFVKQFKFRNEDTRWKPAKKEQDFTSKDVKSRLIKDKRKELENLFWSSSMNSASRISYGWLSSLDNSPK